MKKGLYICSTALLVCSIVIVQCVSSPKEPGVTPTALPEGEEPALEPDMSPAAEPTPESTVITESTPEAAEPATQPPEVGEPWFVLSDEQIKVNSLFSTELRINTGDQKVAAYGLHINYDPVIINLDAGKGNSGVVAGADGFVAAVNATKAGKIVIAGFDTIGKGPGKNLHFLTIFWKAVKKGSTAIETRIDKISDELARPIGKPKGRSILFEVK